MTDQLTLFGGRYQCPACGVQEPNDYVFGLNHSIPVGDTQCISLILKARHRQHQKEQAA